MTAPQPWQSLLAAPLPCDHVVQLYTDDAFLIRAVTHFVGAGLAQGEAAVVIATPGHRRSIADALAERVDVAAATAREQLVMLDAAPCLAQFTVDGAPDRERFRTAIGNVLDRVRAAGRSGARLFGEMVNLMWQENLPAALQLEALWTELLAERRIALLCAYRIDNFDRRVHRGLLHQIGRSHSHLVPVEDYARFDRAVDRAYRDVFGAGGDATALRQIMMSQPTSTTRMPPAQTALVALRQLRGDIADAVLARARDYYAGVAAGA